MLFGGFLIGVLRPTNTWDYPTYLILAIAIVSYALLMNRHERFIHLPWLDEKLHVVINWIVCVGLVVLGSQLFFEPFARWYGLAYGKIDFWQNEKTPIWSYLTQWGLFLFSILMWMAWETRQWLANTPVSHLNKILPYKSILLVLTFGTILTIIGFQVGFNVPIAWFVLPLALWTLLLLFKPDNSPADRFIFFLIGTGFLLTIMVEIIVLSGDIGRMNTVFKFYLQVWTLFAISASYALGKILSDMAKWGTRRQFVFDVVGLTLLAGALLFTLTATYDKIRDRMAEGVPFTFDTMTYMQFAKYWDQQELDLSKDYKAIRWMQQNVEGSPVIVEANSVEYRWGTRFTIYTGLPGVVGWNWHERQQRALFPGEWVSDRVNEVNGFYNDRNIESTVTFLRKYGVKYIILGELEQQSYEADGLKKFSQFDGIFWKTVYDESGVKIYEVFK
jgi:YYY domain-containing protein